MGGTTSQPTTAADGVDAGMEEETASVFSLSEEMQAQLAQGL
jgi:hypothetical protein